MKNSPRAASRTRHVVCPFCESEEVVLSRPGFARCDCCGLPLLGSGLDTNYAAAESFPRNQPCNRPLLSRLQRVRGRAR